MLQRPPPARLHGDDEPNRGRTNAWGSSLGALRNPSKEPQSATARANSHEHQDKKSSKAKDLSHVPCKFFKASSCTAGKSCPFSHDLTNPGTTKPICQWYAKGNCKFGHKCALAHILPGQPMSFDRKNKRAAQAALREAQAAGIDPSSNSPPPATATSPNGRQGSGLARSLKQSVDLSADQNEWLRGVGLASPPQAIGNAPFPSREINADVFGSSSSSEGGPLRPLPTTQAAFGSLSSSTATLAPTSGNIDKFLGLAPSSPPQIPLNLNLAPTPTATFITPHAPSGLSQTLAQQFNSTSSASNGGNRSSVAAQVMLGAQARRLSSTSHSNPPPPSDSLSPPRLGSQPQRTSFSHDLPNAIPSSTSHSSQPRASPSIFGTSPFSGGGNRALFMPSSYDSNEDSFPRSPPSRNAGGLEEMRRSSSVGWGGGGGGGEELAMALELDGLEDEEEDEEGGGYDEGFLPSSLNDLLTPEEQRRRGSRMGFGGGGGGGSGGGGGGGFDPFAGAKSVPAEMMLARGRPMLSSSASAGAGLGARGWGTLSASVEGTNPTAKEYTPSPYSPPAPTPRSLLSVGISAHDSTASLAAPTSHTHIRAPHAHPQPGIYSSSFDARSLLHPPSSSPSYASHFLPSSSSTSTAVPLPLAAPSSLPGGLAAGLSQLHLIPPRHTGDTPPTSSSILGATSPARQPAWAGSWGSPSAAALAGAAGAESPRTFAAAAAGARIAPRRMSSHLPSSSAGGASPLRNGNGGPAAVAAAPNGGGSAGSEVEGEEEEIQFSMDT